MKHDSCVIGISSSVFFESILKLRIVAISTKVDFVERLDGTALKGRNQTSTRWLFGESISLDTEKCAK